MDNPWTFELTAEMAAIQFGLNYYISTNYPVHLVYSDTLTMVFEGGSDALNQFSLQDPTKTGYEFDDWYTDSNKTTAVDWTDFDIESLLVDGKLYLYAKFNPITYTIKFNVTRPDGTTVTEVPDAPGSITATYDVARALPDYAISADGWYFLGWSKTSGATTADYTNKQSVVNLTATKNEEINLYAVFSDVSTVILTVNYATDTTAEMVKEYGIEKVNGENLQALVTRIDLGQGGGKVNLKAEAKLGYLFSGWYTTAAAADADKVVFDVDGSLRVTVSTTIYAKFVARGETTLNLRYDGSLLQTIIILEGHEQVLPTINISGTVTSTEWYEDVNENGIKDNDENEKVETVIGSNAGEINLVAKVVSQTEI